MRKYRDVPMDYVDADLVAHCEQEGVEKVLTLDVRGFSAFRKLDGKAFTILPAPAPRRSPRAGGK
jgi:predicted nucleic acid-binding protein